MIPYDELPMNSPRIFVIFPPFEIPLSLFPAKHPSMFLISPWLRIPHGHPATNKFMYSILLSLLIPELPINSPSIPGTLTSDRM